MQNDKNLNIWSRLSSIDKITFFKEKKGKLFPVFWYNHKLHYVSKYFNIEHFHYISCNNNFKNVNSVTQQYWCTRVYAEGQWG